MEQSLGTLLQCMSELRKSERFGRILLIILKIGNVRRCSCGGTRMDHVSEGSAHF